MDDRVAEVVVTAEEHGVVEVVFVEEVLEGEVGVALLIFPTSSHQWMRCNCQQRSPSTITSDFKGEVEYSSLSTKLAVLSV